MEGLQERFDRSARAIGMNPEEMQPVFYNASAGLRFEIGGAESIYLSNHSINPEYEKNAVYRAYTLMENLPACPDVLRIDRWSEEKDDLLEHVAPPDLRVRINADDTDSPFWGEHWYWDLNEKDVPRQWILREIIKADIGGKFYLNSCVFWMDTKNDVMYYLYDDLGADVVAADEEPLRPLYERFNDWILDYDRDKIRQRFEGK